MDPRLLEERKGFWNFLLLGTKGVTNSIHISLNKELLCCTPPGPLLFCFTLVSRAPFTHHGSLSSAPKAPTLDSSLQHLCPAPSRPSGAPQSKMRIRLPLLCNHPSSTPIRTLPASLNLVSLPLLPIPSSKSQGPSLPYSSSQAVFQPVLAEALQCPQVPCPRAPSLLKPCF